MNISPVGTTYAAPLTRAAQAPSVAPGRPAGATGVSGARPAARDLPVEAPKGTDVQLWSVLTSDERSYFGRVGASRIVVYGPAGGTTAHAARGQALDLRI